MATDGVSSAMWVVAALTFGSGVVVAIRMRETARAPRVNALSESTDVLAGG